jgi:PIN domain nuclease of toxin-antitoxin system
MRLLLDTHTLLWFALNDPLLSRTALSLILDPANESLVSPASYWEIAIKIRGGRGVSSFCGERQASVDCPIHPLAIRS